MNLILVLIISVVYGRIVYCAVSHTNDRIIIIGGGLTGIAAASKLYKNGYRNITILESEKRVGGFLQSEIKKNGDIIEHGLTYILNYQPGTHLHTMLAHLNLVVPKPDRDENMEKFFTYKAFEYPPKLKDKILQLAVSIHLRLLDGVTQERPIEDFISTFIANQVKRKKKYKKFDQVLQQQTVDFYQNFLYQYYPIENLTELSAAEVSDIIYGKNTEEFSLRNKSISTLVDILLNKYPNSSNQINIDIKLSTFVTNIDYQMNTAIITASNNRTYWGDRVIMAVPFGMLKHNYQNYFTPRLPHEHIQVIQNLNVKSFERITFEFDFPISRHAHVSSLSILWTHEDFQLLRFTGKHWLRSFVGVFEDESNPKLLQALFVGPYAKETLNVDTDIIKNEILIIYRRMLKNKINVTEPVAVYRTNYSTSVHCRGIYSYRMKSAFRNNILNSNLALPVKNRNGKEMLFIAGEAASDNWYGYLEGEIESGFEAANKIIRIV